jgi:SAM-dependent methyltransferase
MAAPPNAELKAQVRDYWNRQSCDTQVAKSEKFSRAYFEEIERFRYFDQPFIHSFAQFTRYYGKSVVEVGFGAGTDFIQWLRAGAKVSGVDLTPEALENLRQRIQTYGLPEPDRIEVADAENLPFPNESFDLGYSFGVLHHTPNTECGIRELVRVVRRGGEIKIMLYNRHSVYAASTWVKHALLKARPWRNLTWTLANHMESPGTKGYTRRELRTLLKTLPLTDIRVHTELTSADYLSALNFPLLNLIFRFLINISGVRHPWRPKDYVPRINEPREVSARLLTEHQPEGFFTGQRFGFFHCISARKI